MFKAKVGNKFVASMKLQAKKSKACVYSHVILVSCYILA